MAQTGQLRGRVSEDQLIELLEQVRSRLLVSLDVIIRFVSSQAEEAQSKGAPKKGAIVVCIHNVSNMNFLSNLE